MAKQQRYRANDTEKFVRQQAADLGVDWRVQSSNHDWRKVSLALDAIAEKRFEDAENILPDDGLSEGNAAIKLVEDRDHTLALFDRHRSVLDWLNGDESDVFEAKDDLDDAGTISWNHLSRVSDRRDVTKHPEDYVYVPRLLAFGDYDNSTDIERGNYEAFTEEFNEIPGVYELYGGHGAQGVALRLTVHDPDIIGVLERLEEYPIIDEDVVNDVKARLEQEAFESWAASDFVHELEKNLDIEIGSPDSAIADVFWEKLSEANYSAEVEGGGNVNFPLREMAGKTSLQDLKAAGITYEVVGS